MLPAPSPRSYKNHRIAIVLAGEAVSALPEAEYVVVPYANGYALTADDGTMLSGRDPLPSSEDAVDLAKSFIDSLTSSEHRWKQDRLLAPVAQVPLVANQNPILGNPQFICLDVSLSFLIDLHNAAEKESATREKVAKLLESSQDHGVKGIVVLPNGDLAFSPRRYSLQLWRAKQATYADEALERLRKAARELAMVNDALDTEQAAKEAPDEYPGAKGLVDLRETTAALQTISTAVPVLVQGFANVQGKLAALPVPPEGEDDQEGAP